MSWVTKTMVLPSSRCSRSSSLLQLGADDRVDGAERLVHQQDVRVGGQAAGHADALLLAAGELARVAVGERRVEADGLADRARPLVGLALSTPLRRSTVATLSRTVRCGSRPGMLHDVADAAPQLDRVARGDVDVVDEDLAARTGRPCG